MISSTLLLRKSLDAKAELLPNALYLGESKADKEGKKPYTERHVTIPHNLNRYHNTVTVFWRVGPN